MTAMLVIGAIVTATTIATTKDVLALIAASAAAVAGIVYLVRRILRVMHVVELLLSIEEALSEIKGRLAGLEEADERAANDHTEVLGLLSAVDEKVGAVNEKVTRVEKLGKKNDGRLRALARDLGVTFRDGDT